MPEPMATVYDESSYEGHNDYFSLSYANNGPHDELEYDGSNLAYA